MIAAPLLSIVLLAHGSPHPTPTVEPAPTETKSDASSSQPDAVAYPDVGLIRMLEELRKSELMLDATGMDEMVAASLTVIEDGMRVAGSFAYLEPMRRMRERGGLVKELEFSQPFVKVYGGSGIATYRYARASVDQGVRHRDEGWCTDVFERRDDGAWILVMRHRASDRPTRITR
ncbi:MAG TPA: hypothetical protein PLS53_18455 [Thermoanaerobaculaceae bacterium]|nr:hypothetical protein [Thermoanaerobaculaceae bacterium]HPS80145.1 hypothetical protein [Thermoanaerobaculaceae bacterium]